MPREDMRKMRDLDDAAEKYGGFTSPIPQKDTHYDLRKISEFCKDKGIEPIDMTIRELNRFIVK